MISRPADFAGAWYPGGESTCIQAIEAMRAEGLSCPDGVEQGIGGIVPHAGWYYSGRIALNVIQCLAQGQRPDTCIIFGRHLHSGGRNFIMKEGAWDTPLGSLEIDRELAERLAAEFPFTVETSTRYEPDNTIELQLPFIKYIFPEAGIVPLGVPPRPASLNIAERAAEIAILLERRVLVLGSTDLTHYGHNYGYTPKGTGEGAVRWVKDENDRRMVDLMVGMDEKGVFSEAGKNQNACCAGAVGAAIAASRALGAKRGSRITYTTSYDVRPDSSFVGYVGVVFS